MRYGGIKGEESISDETSQSLHRANMKNQAGVAL